MPTHCFMEQPVSHLTHEAHQQCQNVDMAQLVSLLDISDPRHSLPDSRKCMKRFLCFRVNSHSLPDETGGRRRPHIPGSFRLCAHCPLSSVGDEQHFVLECPSCGPFRDKSHRWYLFQLLKIFDAFFFLPAELYDCLRICG